MTEDIPGKLFYERLNIIAPELRSAFSGPLPLQSTKLMTMMEYAIRNIEHPEEFGYTVSKLADRYRV